MSILSQFLPTFYPLGDRALVIQYKEEIAIQVSQQVQQLANEINSAKIKGIVEQIPTYHSLTVIYDPLVIRYDHLVRTIHHLIINQTNTTITRARRTLHVPITFASKYAKDLAMIAETTQLSEKEIIEKILAKEYYVYMIGFLAGFPYCGDIAEELRLPRRKTPRVHVDKGSVLIAEQQISIYPLTAPSGWHIIGYTPLSLFNARWSPASLFRAGDYLQFEKVSEEFIDAWDESVEKEWHRKWHQLRL